MTKIFTVPFAFTGDKEEIPDALQPDGSVSFTQGFGFDYERPTADPLYKPFPRDPYNWLMGAMTEAIGEVQVQGAATWQAAGAPYPVDARVYYSGKVWRSLTPANSAEPGTSLAWDDGSSPAGTESYFAGPVANIPTGWLLEDGATISRTAYARLFAAIGTTYGSGNGSTTFKIPDSRGEFIRALDNGRGIDPGRTLGSAQGDAIRNITGSTGAYYGPGTSVNTGALASGFYGDAPAVAGTPGGSAGANFNVNFNAANAPGVVTAAENRPRSVARNVIIKY